MGEYSTGDGAAAPRYIEARLTKFALHVAYSPKVTEWQLSYDGRAKLSLPSMKFPMLLAMGVEGIAAGLSTKILPHNFNELIDASVKFYRENHLNWYQISQQGVRQIFQITIMVREVRECSCENISVG